MCACASHKIYAFIVAHKMRYSKAMWKIPTSEKSYGINNKSAVLYLPFILKL